MKLEKIPGVNSVVVDPVSGRTTLASARPISLDEAKSALSGTDYTIN